MPLVSERLTAEEVNGEWRGTFGQSLSGADKVALAQRFSVSVRTVQRWVTTAGQQRNCVPSRLDAVDPEDWPATYQDRGEATRRMAVGGEADNEVVGNEAEFGRVCASLEDAEFWARYLEQEALDPWLSASWLAFTIQRTARGWEVRVMYSTGVSPEVRASGAGGRR